MDAVVVEESMETYGHLVLLGIVVFIILVGFLLFRFRIFKFLFATLWRICLLFIFLVFVGVLILLFTYLASAVIIISNIMSEKLVFVDTAIDGSSSLSSAAIVFGVTYTTLLMINTATFSFIRLHSRAYTGLVFGTTFIIQFLIYPIIIQKFAPGVSFSVLGLLYLNLSTLPIFLIFFFKFIRNLISKPRREDMYGERGWKRNRDRIKERRREQERSTEKAGALVEAILPWIFHRKTPL